ncbi:MAG: hypothetical protein C4521_00170 [Actinobacteria bacterium]|nr:MAG: hypothetical protein C4521_00170 [Actinomycetota bacterium]
MRSVVVYESLWGNTAAIARAIAEGIGAGAKALPTSEATPAEVAEADLIVAGAPVLGFQLPTDKMRDNIRNSPGKAPAPPDLSSPSMRSWLETVPEGKARFAAFETRIWWSLGGATKAIERAFEAKGYRKIAKRQRFIVTGAYGPLKEGEIERARRWGAELARAIEAPPVGSSDRTT